MKSKLPKIKDALEFRREQYGWTKKKMAKELGIGYTHFIEVLNGKRNLSLEGTKRAFNLGVPATVLLQRKAILIVPIDMRKKFKKTTYAQLFKIKSRDGKA